MQIQSLRLVNFRNYVQLAMTPDPGLCVLTGENAAGKTNILESIFLCALGRSHRTARDGELIRTAAEGGSVHLVLDTAGGTRVIDCKLLQAERKKLSIDDAPLARSGELLGCLNVVMFAPEDLALVKDGPAERRRFLDMEISQLRPAYYYTLQQYNLALKQRNALLKDASGAGGGTLEMWDEQLSNLGASITTVRAQFTKELAAAAKRVHSGLSDEKEELLVRYQPSLPDADADGLYDAMRDALFENLERDLYRGYTSVGPHRDDVALYLNGTDVRVYGSQGQQRTVVLSMKLAELEMLRDVRGESPVLLLDDVFSELDRSRQTKLLAAVEGCQTFITCTHLEELENAGVASMQVYHVGNGAIIEL